MSLDFPTTAAFGLHVMYVDDDADLVMLVANLLERHGHIVSRFTAPREALAQFKSHPGDFDVIVTDLSMPCMSGIDLAREMRAIREDTLVLMVTGHIDGEDAARARDAGVREVILKTHIAGKLAQAVELSARQFQTAPDANSRRQQRSR
jgi:CheY-like chemotaxis protein